jgi:hypothetical protein
MNALRALSSIAAAHVEARSKRRTANIIADLPESVQKDIGWRWTSSKHDRSGALIRWDLI